MGSFLVACILFGILTFTVDGQQQNRCLRNQVTDCYFTGAATRAVNEPNPNKYFIIGGMFDVHNKGDTAYDCSSAMSEMSFVNLLVSYLHETLSVGLPKCLQ